MPLFNRLRRNGPGPGAGTEVLKRCRAAVGEVNALESRVRMLGDEALRATAGNLRRRLAKGADPAAVLPEAFATVREVAKRTIGQRLVDEQIMGGAALHLGVLAEMKTGEGKTLTITLPAYLNALSGSGVHVMTANDYLAARDAEWMGPVYRALGLECALVKHEDGRSEPARRRAAYAADVTYGTLNEMACDYLRDNLAEAGSQLLQRGQAFAIVDEADSVMIDDALTRPSLGVKIRAEDGQIAKAKADAIAVARIVERFERDRHYRVDEARKAVTLTDEGIALAEDRFGVSDFYGSAESARLRSLFEDALKARGVYVRDRDYAVDDGAILAVDASTGRVQPRAVFESGLAQAIEVKEGLAAAGDGAETAASISAHAYLRRYGRLAGVTAVVAGAEAEAYQRIYGLESVAIATHRPVLRIDRPVTLFRTDRNRLGAVVEAVAAKRAAGRPVVVGAGSIAQSEQISGALAERGIPHQVLNAENHQAEGQIIAEAGRVGAVTVVTRMAGRGVDIPLGGDDPAEHAAVVDSGGMYVVAADLYETRRLELQMRGRAGRRGDPGESDIFLSCEDATLVSMLPPQMLASMADIALTSSRDKRHETLERLFSRGLETELDRRTQRQVQGIVSMIPVDDVLGGQREEVYRLRRELFSGAIETQAWLRAGLDEVVRRHVAAAALDDRGLAALWQDLGAFYPIGVTGVPLAGSSREAFEAALRADAQAAYSRWAASIVDGSTGELALQAVLRAIDRSWRGYLAEDAELVAATRLQSSAGADFLDRYRRESERRFAALLVRIQEAGIRSLFGLDAEAEGKPEQARADH